VEKPQEQMGRLEPPHRARGSNSWDQFIQTDDYDIMCQIISKWLKAPSKLRSPCRHFPDDIHLGIPQVKESTVQPCLALLHGKIKRRRVSPPHLFFILRVNGSREGEKWSLF
jgi:hypothetical protein